LPPPGALKKSALVECLETLGKFVGPGRSTTGRRLRLRDAQALANNISAVPGAQGWPPD
jgi:hypothetical protein